MAKFSMASVPVLLLALFVGWSGTLFGGATAWGATVGPATLLLAAFFGGPPDLDPLGLGPGFRHLPIILYGVILLGWWRSPVPRAGQMAVLLLPALLLLPSVVVRCWRMEERRRVGHMGVAVVVAALALHAVVQSLESGEPARGLLGHHLILVACLLPLTGLLSGNLRSPWRPLVGASRLAFFLAIVALVATRSVLGILGLGVIAVGSLPLRLRKIVGVIALVVGAGVLAGFVGGNLTLPPQLLGEESSWLARQTYWEAGLDGWSERPWLGWGLGSTAWTIANHLDPRPGINPAGEVVGDLHSWPLQWLREVGVVGAVLLFAVVVAWWRRRSREEVSADRSSRSERLGLLALGVYGLAGVSLGTSAGWVVLAVVIGSAMPLGVTQPGDGAAEVRSPHWIWRLYALGAIVLWIPSARAHFAYDEAIRIGSPQAVQQLSLESAVARDPGFLLYRVRQVSVTPVEPLLTPWPESMGLAHFWLVHAQGVSGAARTDALQRALDLDPLDWAAPFLLMTDDPATAQAPSFGARAVLLEPRLIASRFLGERLGLRALVAREVRAWPGVDAGLREAVSRALVAETAEAASGRLVVEWDSPGEASPSIHLFRRSPAIFEIVSVPIDLDLADRINLPSAATLPSTARSAFGRKGG